MSATANVYDFPVDEESAPFIPEGEYRFKFEGYRTFLFSKSPRLEFQFSVVDFGPYFGTRLSRFYCVEKLTGKHGKNGKCIHKKKGDFLIEFYELFPDQPKRPRSRVPVEPFRNVLIIGKVTTVKQNSLQKQVPEQLWYSKIAKLVGIDK